MNRGIHKLITGCLVMFLVFVCTVGSVHAQLKMGYIRPMFILEKYEPYQEAQRQLAEIKKTQDEKLKKDEDQLQQNLTEAQKKQMLMSEEMIARTREELAKQKDALDKSYSEFYQPGGEFEKKQEELIQPIINKINEVIMRIGKDEGYDFIFDADQGGVLFADNTYDISELILGELLKDVTKK